MKYHEDGGINMGPTEAAILYRKKGITGDMVMGMVTKGISLAEIARRLKCSRENISQHVKRCSSRVHVS